MQQLACVLAFAFTITSCAKLPSTFIKCNRKEPNFKACVLKAAQNGIEQFEKLSVEFKLVRINPFEVKKLEVGGNGVVTVDQKFRDCKFYGFNEAKIKQFEFDFEKKVFYVDVLFPQIKMFCDYELNGKVLLLPIQGKGKSTVELRNLRSVSTQSYEEVKKHNKTFIKPKSMDINIEPDLVQFNFENLFSGGENKELGQNINQVLNDNWIEVFGSVKDGYTQVVKTIVLKLLNDFFSKVSMEEAFD